MLVLALLKNKLNMPSTKYMNDYTPGERRVLFCLLTHIIIPAVRIMSNIMTKIENANRLWLPLVILIRLLSTVAISFAFAPIFFVIQLITLQVQFWKINKESTIH